MKFVEEFKYLGVMITKTLKDNVEICRRMRKMYAIGNTIISKFKNCQDLCKILMFKTYCSNVYACALWTNYNISAYHHMKVAHNDVYRILMKIRRGPNHSVSALFVQNRVNNLESII